MLSACSLNTNSPVRHLRGRWWLEGGLRGSIDDMANGTKTLTSGLARVSPVRLTGWAGQVSLKRLWETIGDLTQSHSQ